MTGARTGLFGPYRAALATPGATAFVAASFVLRLPLSMLALGTVLLVSATTGSYGVAGAVSATVVLLQSASAPPLGRLVDRVGQTRVLLPALAVHLAGFGALAWVAVAGGPTWALFPSGAAYGAAYVPIESLVRARWAHALTGTDLLPVAYSLESMLDEVIFIVGPVLVTVLATAVAPVAGLAAAVLFVAIGTLALVPQRRTQPPVGTVDGGPRRSALRARGLLLLTLAAVPLGGIFGSVEVATVAFTAERDAPAAAGLVLALFAGGSLLSGLAYGAIRWRASLRRRFLVGMIALAAAITTLPLAPGVPALAALTFASGFAISPTVISAFGLTEALVPAVARTEGLTWLTTGMGLGVAAAAAVVGRIIDADGARAGYAVTVGCGAAAVLLVAAGMPRLRPDAQPAAEVA